MASTEPILDASNPASPLSIPASQTALLLMDFHTFLVGSMPAEGQQAAATAASLREWAKSQSIKVVHCLIDFECKAPPHFKMLVERGAQVQDAIRKAGPQGPGEVAELIASPDEYTFWRPLGYVSAMSSYGLDAFLTHHGIKSVVLSGVATSGCVIDTAKAAAESGLIVTVIEDACADRVVETHEFIVKKLLGRSCHVTTKDAFVAAWK